MEAGAGELLPLLCVCCMEEGGKCIDRLGLHYFGIPAYFCNDLRCVLFVYRLCSHHVENLSRVFMDVCSYCCYFFTYSQDTVSLQCITDVGLGVNVFTGLCSNFNMIVNRCGTTPTEYCHLQAKACVLFFTSCLSMV